MGISVEGGSLVEVVPFAMIQQLGGGGESESKARQCQKRVPLLPVTDCELLNRDKRNNNDNAVALISAEKRNQNSKI